jgi:hypothetical protein
MQGAPLGLDREYDRWLRAHEVVRHPHRLVHAAVLMVNRDRDPIIPFVCAERTAAVLTRAYRRAGVPERFRFTVFDSDQHGLDRRDTEETLAWLIRWLGGPGGAPGAGRDGDGARGEARGATRGTVAGAGRRRPLRAAYARVTGTLP